MKNIILLISSVIALGRPFIVENSQHFPKNYSVNLPTTFNGFVLEELNTSEHERAFYDNFPGKTALYKLKSSNGEQIFFRYLETPSRKLHPAEECYKANGTDCVAMEKKIIRVEELSQSPITWGQFKIKENGSEYIIRQAVISLGGKENYSDIPSWYWLTVFSDNDPGPWLAITWKLKAQH